jgi:type III restriction enzyme
VTDAVIDNPILNAPFDEPSRHWKFERDGITNEIVEGRRESSYFMPIPKSRRGGDQLQFETEWTSDRIEENRTINQIRERVGLSCSIGVAHQVRAALFAVLADTRPS